MSLHTIVDLFCTVLFLLFELVHLVPSLSPIQDHPCLSKTALLEVSEAPSYLGRHKWGSCPTFYFRGVNTAAAGTLICCTGDSDLNLLFQGPHSGFSHFC